MKKLLITLLIMVLLSSCSQTGKEVIDPNERYIYIVNLLEEHESYNFSSMYFDIEGEMAKIDEGYRYYITIDNPSIAMYDIELLAIEKDVDYLTNMAPNIGIFEDTQYNMVPNQTDISNGYMKGIVASGLSSSPKTTLYVFVQFKNQDFSNVHTEYIKLNIEYTEDTNE